MLQPLFFFFIVFLFVKCTSTSFYRTLSPKQYNKTNFSEYEVEGPWVQGDGGEVKEAEGGEGK